MGKYYIKLASAMLLTLVILTRPSQAVTSYVHVEFLKAGLIVGAGIGRGVLDRKSVV